MALALSRVRACHRPGGRTGHAAADPGNGKKKSSGSADAQLGADQGTGPDCPRRANNTDAAQALTVIQRRIADYVADHGTSYTFSYLDSDTGRIVLDSYRPASVVSELTSMSDWAGGLRSARPSYAGRPSPTRSTAATTSRRSGGGAGITNSGSICSSGYAVRNAVGTVFSVTAGHCFANGTNALVESGLRSYGTVSSRRLPTVTGHPMDMELLGGQTYVGGVPPAA